MLEFLILNGNLQAAKHYNSNSQSSLREQLTSHFSKGNRIQFMDLFAMLHKQSKLQFYLRVYFLIYNIHPALKGKGSIPEPEKVAFKEYLDTKGAQLAKTSEFLQFYALPFIKKPLEHLAFKNLFKKQWVSNLKQKLQLYITQQQRYLKAEAAKLFGQGEAGKLSQPAQSQNTPQTKILQQRVKEMQKINKKLFEEVKQFTQKYHILEDNHKVMIQGYNTHMMEAQSKWFQITKQLVQCSKSLVQMLITSDSDFITDKKFLKIKKKTEKYERFVNKKFDDLVSHSQDISILDRPSISDLSYSVPAHTQKNLTSHSHTHSHIFPQIDSYIPTDFHALKQSLKKSTLPQKISLLNGLYFRILKSKPKDIRKLNILGILYYDVLGIKSGEIAEMLVNRQLMKPCVRLIQLISFDNLGKKVAFSGELIRDFVGLVGQCQDSGCFQYVITVLGQISSEKQFKIRLIQQDIIEVCMDILRSGKYIKNETVLQNVVAVILNMLQKSQGLKKCEQQKDIFSILKQCLYANFKIGRALIYGIIFALLQSEQLFKRAHQQNLSKFLDNILQIDPNINRTQLRYLKNKLKKFQPKQKDEEEVEEEIEGDEDEEDYEIEEQYIQELEDMMKVHEDMLRKYMLKGKDATLQIKEVKEVMDEWRDKKLPKFNSVQQNKNISKFSSPKPKLPQISQNQNMRSPQPLPNQAINVPAKKTNNFMQPENLIVSKSSVYQNVGNSFNVQNKKDRDRPSRIQAERMTDVRDIEKNKDRENYQSDRRMKKSVSADRGIGNNIGNNIYQSNRFNNNNNKVSQFKPAEERQYRSPQQKKPREQVLRQINQQIRAEQMMKEKKKAPIAQNSIQRDIGLYSSERNKRSNEPEGFQSRPKLRRTPPKQ